MPRICFAFIFLFSLISGHSQVRIELFGGPQLTTAKYTVTGIKQPTQFKPGLMLGAGAKVMFENNLYFFPEVFYSLKGYKVTLNNPAYPPTQLAKNNNTTIHTLEFAPLFQVDLTKKPSYWYLRFGPSFDFAFSGTEKFDTIPDGGTVKRKILFDYTAYGHITASVNIQVGYQMADGLTLFAHYLYGLGSFNNADNGPKILHRAFGISAGWMFGEIHPKRRTRMPKFQYMR